MFSRKQQFSKMAMKIFKTLAFVVIFIIYSFRHMFIFYDIFHSTQNILDGTDILPERVFCLEQVF